MRTEMGLQKYEFFQRRIECVSNAVPPALFVGDASIASLQVSNQGSSRANALSGRRHVRLSMAAKAGEGVTVGPGPSSGSGPLTQATKANNESSPKKKCRFMGAKIGKKCQSRFWLFITFAPKSAIWQKTSNRILVFSAGAT